MRVRRLDGYGWTCLLAIGAGLCVRWPALLGGLRGDDYVQAAMLRGAFPGRRAAWDLFRFAGPGAADNAPLIDFGYLPWWTSPELSLSMFRPLASLLVAADHALFGEHFVLFHVHSLLWWAAVVLVAGRLLFDLLPGSVAAPALVIFALDEAHNIPVAWLANRSTLISTALGLFALYAHVRARASTALWHRALVWVSLVLAVSAGEYALSALCYPLAYEALRAAPAASRIRACVPTLLVAMAYVAVRAALGHGVADSGFYLSPVSDPIGYARATLSRVPVLLADLTFGLPALYLHTGGPFRTWLLALGPFDQETWNRIPNAATIQTAVGYVAILVTVGLFRYGRRPLEPKARQALAWLLVGALLGLFPAASAIPEDRLTLASAFGMSAVLGAAFARTDAIARAARGRSLPALLLALSLCGAHAGWAAVRDLDSVETFARRSRAQRSWSLDAELPTHGAERAHVYLLGASDFTTAANLPFVRWYHGRELPRSYRRLSGASLANDITRIDDRTLEVMAHGGALPGTVAGSLYRPVDKPIRNGNRFEIPGLEVEVRASWDGNPITMRYTFDRSLDDPQLWLMQATGAGLKRIKPPPVGSMQRMPAPAGR